MTQEILIKVYGHVWPVQHSITEDLRPCFPPSEHMEQAEMLEFEKDMLRLAYEGIYFDIDCLLPHLEQHLTPQSQGKVDYIDLEAWVLTRYRIEGTNIIKSSAPLNAVLDYASSH